jgi:hypothetical protein
MSPGRHTLELVAISNGLQSNSSAPIVVRVLAGQVTDENSTATFDETAPRVSSQGIVCLPESGSTCYQARVLATGVNRIDSLVAPAPDRALFIENGEHLRRLDGDVLSSPITLPELSGKRLLSLAIPDDEARGRLVFVVWAESSGPGIDMLGVTRYREVGASLGEPATIVVDVPIVAGTHAPAAFDDEDRLYVAVVAPQSDSGRPSVNPAILRFALDGAVPATNPASQIIVTSGFSQPGALAWDRDQRGLWLSGTDPRWASPVLTLPVAPDGQLGSLQTPELDVEGITGLPMAERPSVLLAPTRRASQSNTAQTGVWLVWSPGRVFWGMRAGTRTSLKPVTFGEIGVPTLIAQDPDQNLLLVTDSGLTGGATVWRLIVR